jgi:two-component system, OmpR family, sensor histidine kinase ChvG
MTDTPATEAKASSRAQTRAERRDRARARVAAREARRKASPSSSGRRQRGGIGGLIFIANFAAVVILILGSLLFNELRTGLTQARVDTLRAQGSTIASIIAETSVAAEPEPALDERRARAVLKRLFREPGARLRLFDEDRRLIADSAVLYDEITVRPLPPIGPAPPDIGAATQEALTTARVLIQGALGDPTEALAGEVSTALTGRVAARERFDENGLRVVSVSVPIQRVRAVVGVLTLESADVTGVIDAERRALYPFIAAAIVVAAISSTLLAWSIARPLRQLALAADEVGSGRSQTLAAADLIERSDEIGEMAEALQAMTASLQQRIDANERFAADVAHEIKNPLAAIRNAAELLPRIPPGPQRDRLEGIILADAGRADRLITDISNASRLDAELARTNLAPLSLADLVDDLGRSYASLADGREVAVAVHHSDPAARLMVQGRGEALGRVLTNLLDNALSFAPPGSTVRMATGQRGGLVRVSVEDEGPGIPEEALDQIFRRFYTHRPGGQKVFGTHSGLGLSIARQIAEGHGGRLWAENRRAKASGDGAQPTGARFVLELPAA